MRQPPGPIPVTVTGKVRTPDLDPPTVSDPKIVRTTDHFRPTVSDSEPDWPPFDPQDDGRGESVASWAPLDLADVIAGDWTPEPPTFMPRTDGPCLLYRGKTHALYGESESGKSLVMQAEAARLVNLGELVVYLDFESNKGAVCSRLLAMGARPEAILSHFHYIRPEDKPTASDAEHHAFQDLLNATPALVVVDGVTNAMELLAPPSRQGDPNERISAFSRMYADLIARRTGAAVVSVDHIPKPTGVGDHTARHAVGGQQKLNVITGAAYRVKVLTAPKRGQIGRLSLIVTKDREGGVREHAGQVVEGNPHLQEVALVTINGEGDQIAVTVRPPAAPSAETRPLFVMEKVSAWLEAHPGKHSRSAVVEAVRARAGDVRESLDHLTTSGHVHLEVTERGSRTDRHYQHRKRYRVGQTEEDDQ